MNPLDLLEAPMRAVLAFFHGLGFTWGWAIVMLTLLVRLILLPLFVKQYNSARRMQEVAPQMKELQRKYKGNKPKLQEEMMKFYKENAVNPFGSSLPLVAQAPVVRDIRVGFDVHPTMDRRFVYTILGGRIDPTARYTATIDATGAAGARVCRG